MVQPSLPILILRRSTEPDLVGFERVPTDEQQIRTRALEAALQRVGPVAWHRCDDRLRLGEGRLEGGLLPRADLERRDLEDHRRTPVTLPFAPLEEIVGTARTARAKVLAGREIATAIDPELPLVAVDPVLIDQLLVNLLENVLRHAVDPPGAPKTPIELPGLEIDLARREVRVDGREIRLTPIEFKILALLARNAGRVLTHRQILTEVWGPGHAGENHNVRVHVALLRKKIELDATRPQRLMTESGVGYRLRDREAE